MTGLREALLRRELYKRALVVSRGFPSALHWDRVERVFASEGEHWEDRLRVSELLQEALMVRAADFSLKGTMVSSVTPNDADRFVARCGRKATLILVDYPPMKPGARTELKILREHEVNEAGEDDLSVSTLEASTVWGRLREEGMKSLAKLRVFCHPDFRSLFRVSSTRTEFEELLDDAVEEVA